LIQTLTYNFQLIRVTLSLVTTFPLNVFLCSQGSRLLN
jgi:hypothetical protein